jgi:hypothetical protein
MREYHMGFEEIGRLTFPQAFQLANCLLERYGEQKRQIEANKINSTIRGLRYGR